MLLNDVQVTNEEGRPCAIGEVGELCVRGSHIFSGYWQNDAETAKVLRGGWLHTGDLAYMDEDGDYAIVGRKKEMIITGGENVYPQEVEQCLLAHPSIQKAAVLGVPHDIWGECVVAFIVARQLDVDTLRAYCKETLASYKIPKQFYDVEQLPTTAVGKIDKKILVQQAIAASQSTSS